MLGRLRSTVAPLKRMLASPLARAGVHPDAVTLAAIPLALAAGWLVLQGHPLAALVPAVPAVLLDFVDGEVARLQGRVTPFGDLLEAVVDRVVEGLLLAALAVEFPLAAAASLGLSVLVSYVKARTGLVVPCDNRDWPGCGDHSDRVLMIVAALVARGCWGPGAAEGVLWALAATAFVGVLGRLRYARLLIAGKRGTPPGQAERGAVPPPSVDQ